MSVRYGKKNLSQGSLFWHHEALSIYAKQWPEGQICLSVPYTYDIFFFLHTFLSQGLNKLQFYLKICHTFTSAILFWRRLMTLLWRSLATKFTWHYNQCYNTMLRALGSEHQGQTSISKPDQNLGFTYIFSSGMQETRGMISKQRTRLIWYNRKMGINGWGI